MINNKEQTVSENEKKKVYLKSYRPLVKAAEIAESQLLQLRLDKICPTVIYDDMPHGNTKSDLSDYMVKLDELEQELLKARFNKIKRYTEIEIRIGELEDIIEQNILKLKYIEGKKWVEVCLEIGYEWSRTHEKHSDALKHFRL